MTLLEVVEAVRRVGIDERHDGGGGAERDGAAGEGADLFRAPHAALRDAHQHDRLGGAAAGLSGGERGAEGAGAVAVGEAVRAEGEGAGGAGEGAVGLEAGEGAAGDEEVGELGGGAAGELGEEGVEDVRRHDPGAGQVVGQDGGGWQGRGHGTGDSVGRIKSSTGIRPPAEVWADGRTPGRRGGHPPDAVQFPDRPGCLTG